MGKPAELPIKKSHWIGSKTSYPVRFKHFRTFPHTQRAWAGSERLCRSLPANMGDSVGQMIEPHFVPRQKVQIYNKKHPKFKDFRCFLELLGGFEPPTSSLPTNWEPSSLLFSTLSGHFCSKKMRSVVRFGPLFPSVRFSVWVSVWVKREFANVHWNRKQ